MTAVLTDDMTPKQRANACGFKPGDFLTPAQVAELLGYKVRTIYVLKAESRMPAPDQHISRIPMWRCSTITAWMEETGRPNQPRRTA